MQVCLAKKRVFFFFLKRVFLITVLLARSAQQGCVKQGNNKGGVLYARSLTITRNSLVSKKVRVDP